MNKKYSNFILFFFGMFLLSGCGAPDCSEQDTTYSKYTYDEELKECKVLKQIPKDECGNNVAEEGETFCNCGEDVMKTLPFEKGGCDGSKSEFLEYACNNNEECVLEETKKVLMTSKLADFKSGSYFNIETKINYNQPLILDRHTVNAEFMLKTRMDTDTVKVRDLMIKDVKVVTSTNELLGSKTVDLIFDEQYDTFEASITLDGFSFEEFEKIANNVNLKLLITYTKETYTKQDGSYVLYKSEPVSIELKNTFEKKLILINPENDFGSQ